MHTRGRIAAWFGLGLGLGVGLVGGCLNIGAYECSDSNQCAKGTQPGYCQPTGFCSYPDAVCPTGFRYGEEAEGALAGECVPPIGATSTDTDTTVDPSTGSSSGSSSETGTPTTLEPTTTTDTSGSETGDTCGALDQECCTDDACDDGLSCFGGTCGCVEDMAAGTNHTCVLRVDGSVLCWGANDTGQIDAMDPSVALPGPQLVAPTLLGGDGLAATELAASTHTCALREDGNAVCWGENATGASVPGLPSVTPAVPTEITLATNWVQPAVGIGFTCIARSSDALATCFGSNDRGQLTGADAPGPVDVPSVFSFAEIDAGIGHVCGRAATGEMYCWGENGQGQLGINPATVPFSTTVRELSLPPVGDVATGSNHTCARVGDAVQCFGDNAFGQLGDGTTTDSIVSVIPTLPPSPIATLQAFGNNTCAKLGTGETYCWGDNQGDKLRMVGETVDDTLTSVPLLLDPVDSSAMPIAVDVVAMGNAHACVLSDTHAVYCWGLSGQGQAGVMIAQQPTPAELTIACE